MTGGAPGEGLVCLHGFSGQPESWREVLVELRRRRPHLKGYCPALLGHGLQGPEFSGHGFEDEVDRLAQGVVDAGMEGSHLAGYSMGGRLALGLLVRHGRLFRGATLIGIHGGLPSAAARAQRRALDERRAQQLEEDGLETFLAAWESLPLFASQAALPDDVQRRQRSLRRGHRAAGLAAALRCLGPAAMPDYHSLLPTVTCPVTLMVGEHDGKFQDLAKPLVDGLPKALLQVVPRVGHNVLLEAPKAVAQRLDAEMPRPARIHGDGIIMRMTS